MADFLFSWGRLWLFWGRSWLEVCMKNTAVRWQRLGLRKTTQLCVLTCCGKCVKHELVWAGAQWIVEAGLIVIIVSAKTSWKEQKFTPLSLGCLEKAGSEGVILPWERHHVVGRRCCTSPCLQQTQQPAMLWACIVLALEVVSTKLASEVT